jgi:hypothetical protein
MSAWRLSSRWLAFALSVLVAGLALCLTPAAVSAQDGGVPESSNCDYPPESSCSTCHAQLDSKSVQGEWHVVHARNDVCRNCHGGDDRTMDKDQAHVGMMPNPLDDTYLSCHACHIDYQQRAEKFAAVLGVTPQSHEPVTVTLGLNQSGNAPAAQLPVASPLGTSDAGAGWWLALLAAAILFASALLARRRLSHSAK